MSVIVNTDQKKLQKKAKILCEALPYMKKYAGETFVIKYGGNAMIDDELSRQFAEDVVLLKQVGINPIVVHGGGPQIGKMLDRLQLESRFIDGLRVTDEQTVEVAEMVLCGSINKSIVADINAAGGKAIGLSGKDSNLVIAKKRESTIDLGFVGEPEAVNPDILNSSVEAGMIPVIAPIAAGKNGETFNINADTMAGCIAGAIQARRLFLLTDVEGVLNEEKELLTDLVESEVKTLITNGTIAGGMIPKVTTCLDALKGGSNAASIIDGRVMHAILLEIFTERGAGTLIRLTEDD
ncbi:acetylglutamate kinase [Temperatibacter marinus]|uniref:Acetylglutamate kinase n=1 Tax=Temperatibacter marinus TaxID=1456591 RepID=A0AA52EJ06_9PROT|nr:acetylglutamate kinase [Temperatibacter marinus]WND03417.1 acetylglutamate kinase [Temperatibacter marinus]